MTYVDTSAVLALLFREPGGLTVRRHLKSQAHVLSSVLIIAEVLSALSREGIALDAADALLESLELVATDEWLKAECEEVLKTGHLRGANLWHVATALKVVGDFPRENMVFLTLDVSQGAVAKKLGFHVRL